MCVCVFICMLKFVFMHVCMNACLFSCVIVDQDVALSFDLRLVCSLFCFQTSSSFV